jgi:transposase-like protein
MEVLRDLESGKQIGEICRQNDINKSTLYKWKNEYKANPGSAFAGNGKVSKLDAKVADRERLIGELYAENSLLKKAVSRLGDRLAECQKKR